MVEINWTDQSIDDVNNIAEFIAKESSRYAKIQVSIFFEKVSLLEKHPQLGRIVPETQKKNIRELITGNYRIVYRIVSSQRIDIITVHHSARLLHKSILKKR